MAIIEAKKNNGLLGGLGSLATVGGLLTGMPWLSKLGVGMSAIGGGLNNTKSDSVLGKIMTDVLTGQWQKTSDGNIAKTNPNSTDENKELTDEELTKKWAPYYTGGYNTWQL